jgi:hypothetical protein
MNVQADSPNVFGSNAENTTFVFGNPTEPISKVFVSGDHQFAQNDLRSLLARFHSINTIKNGDYQQAISNIADRAKDSL